MSASGAAAGSSGGGREEDNQPMAHLNLDFAFGCDEIMDDFVLVPSGPGQPGVWLPRDERRHQENIHSRAEKYLVGTLAGRTDITSRSAAEAHFKLVAEHAREQVHKWRKLAELFGEHAIDDQVAEDLVDDHLIEPEEEHLEEDLRNDVGKLVKEPDFPAEGGLGEAVDPVLSVKD